jgi:hypothetical protein
MFLLGLAGIIAGILGMVSLPKADLLRVFDDKHVPSLPVMMLVCDTLAANGCLLLFAAGDIWQRRWRRGMAMAILALAIHLSAVAVLKYAGVL